MPNPAPESVAAFGFAPELQVALGTTAAGAAAWALLPPGLGLPGVGAVVAAASGLVASRVWSIQSQWAVPTVFRLPAGTPHLALTFDDGPDPEITPRVLDLLAEFGAQATFFVVGSRVEAHPGVLRQVQAAGHQIGSHSHIHAVGFHFLRVGAMVQEIERGRAAIAGVTGEAPLAFRPPVGLRVPTLRRALQRIADPLVCFTWTERALDTKGHPAAVLVARLRPALRPGAILAMHDGAGFGGVADRQATLAALRELLVQMRGLGLASRRLDATAVPPAIRRA